VLQIDELLVLVHLAILGHGKGGGLIDSSSAEQRGGEGHDSPCIECRPPRGLILPPQIQQFVINC